MTKMGYTNNKSRFSNFRCAFTIVELLIVMVIISILAIIFIVSYGNIANKATIAMLKSDLSSASKQLKSYYAINDVFPSTIDCSGNNLTLPTNLCLKTNKDEVFTYKVDNNKPETFTLYASKNKLIYKITNNSSAIATTIICPINYIVVPGSSTYNTDDFCVMKYEAKIYNNDDGTDGYSSTNYPNSRASGTPYVDISQAEAITQSVETVDGQGVKIDDAHLITEAEWMTIAQNVLSIASNWSGGVVGSGYIYSGHNDNSPSNSLAASTDDGDGYYGTENLSGNQRRTLTLSNGEVIWDMAGNVWKWTSGQTTGNQPGIAGDGYGWRQYTEITSTGSLSVNISPSGTNITGSSTWTSVNGIGKIYSSSDETILRAFARGGYWYYSSYDGILSLYLYRAPSYSSTHIGFRVAI